MMAGLFAVLSFSIGMLFAGKRGWAIWSLLVGLALGWLMLWYHATDPLQIDW